MGNFCASSIWRDTEIRKNTPSLSKGGIFNTYGGCGRQTPFGWCPLPTSTVYFPTKAGVQDSQLQVARSNCFNLISQCKLHVLTKWRATQREGRNLWETWSNSGSPDAFPACFRLREMGYRKTKIRAASSRHPIEFYSTGIRLFLIPKIWYQHPHNHLSYIVLQFPIRVLRLLETHRNSTSTLTIIIPHQSASATQPRRHHCRSPFASVFPQTLLCWMIWLTLCEQKDLLVKQVWEMLEFNKAKVVYLLQDFSVPLRCQ